MKETISSYISASMRYDMLLYSIASCLRNIARILCWAAGLSVAVSIVVQKRGQDESGLASRRLIKLLFVLRQQHGKSTNTKVCIAVDIALHLYTVHQRVLHGMMMASCSHVIYWWRQASFDLLTD